MPSKAYHPDIVTHVLDHADWKSGVKYLKAAEKSGTHRGDVNVFGLKNKIAKNIVQNMKKRRDDNAELLNEMSYFLSVHQDEDGDLQHNYQEFWVSLFEHLKQLIENGQLSDVSFLVSRAVKVATHMWEIYEFPPEPYEVYTDVIHIIAKSHRLFNSEYFALPTIKYIIGKMDRDDVLHELNDYQRRLRFGGLNEAETTIMRTMGKYAIRKGWLQKKHPANVIDKSGYTPLEKAVMQGKVEDIRQHLDSGAKITPEVIKHLKNVIQFKRQHKFSPDAMDHQKIDKMVKLLKAGHLHKELDDEERMYKARPREPALSFNYMIDSDEE